MSHPSPKDLDSQCRIRIDRWIDIDSEEWHELDDNPGFTKKCLKLGFQEPAFLFSDLLGRIWGKGVDGYYYPFYFESYGQNIGYRLSKRAAN